MELTRSERDICVRGGDRNGQSVSSRGFGQCNRTRRVPRQMGRETGPAWCPGIDRRVARASGVRIDPFHAAGVPRRRRGAMRGHRATDSRSTSAHRTHAPNVTRRPDLARPIGASACAVGDRIGQSVPRGEDRTAPPSGAEVPIGAPWSSRTGLFGVVFCAKKTFSPAASRTFHGGWCRERRIGRERDDRRSQQSVAERAVSGPGRISEVPVSDRHNAHPRSLAALPCDPRVG
jgi:hypothetical protein